MNTADARRVEDLPYRFNAAADLLDARRTGAAAVRAAVIDASGTTTYGELAERVDLMAGALLALGLQRGDRILLCLLDCVVFPIAFLGAIRAGIVPVPLNTLLTADDYGWVLGDSGAAAVVVSGELSSAWTVAAAEHSGVRFLSSGQGPWPALADELARAAPLTRPADTRRDEIAFWLYTSGSTGRPKAAMHRHASMRLTANLFGLGVVGYRSTDVVLSVAKLFFAYGLGNALSFPLAAGATVVLLAGRATPAAVVEQLRAHRVTILNGVPTFFASWLADASVLNEGLALRIATSAGECLPARVGERFNERFGIEVIDGLGSTEMLHVFLCQTPGEVRYGCTGRPTPGYEVRIIADSGEEATPGEPGELQVRGPTAAAGYWNNPDKSAATFKGEWTRTGDVYIRDADGWFSYSGRGDDMLKVGGIYVSPAEVEEALTSHEAVMEAAVVGAADSDGLIKPRAFVVLQPGVAKDGATDGLLKAHVKARLAPYKYPRWIVFTDILPRTATGKIQRFRLRAAP